MQDKLEELEKKYDVDWREYKLSEIFEINSSKKIYHANNVKIHKSQIENSFPYIVRSAVNNGLRGYIEEPKGFLNQGNTLSFAQDTFSVFYQKEPYFTGNKVKVLMPKSFVKFDEKIQMVFVSAFQKALSDDTWGKGSTVDTIAETKITLPTQNNEIAFDYIEKFVETLEAERLQTLEAYLVATGLKDTTLTDEERKSHDLLGRAGSLSWKAFNLEVLFGKSTRGRRLKSADRVAGNLPFVTAGEADMGVSAFIGNDVRVFSQNTVTIDMFGSAKYRNYQYGADDHVAVVHTEKLNKFSALFTASAIHKSAHAGQFDYSRNFYATDADELMISLPVKSDGKIDYDFMSSLMSAMQKVVIKGVVDWADKRIEATKGVIDNG